jgi:ATP-dependent Clp protease ATP-binding subunit ClpA
MTPPPSLQSLIDTVIQDAGTDDPIGQLAVAAGTASDLEQTTDALLGHFVDRCRRHGRSWSEISNALGVSKQAVHKRFAVPIAQRLADASGRPTFERFTLRARAALSAAAAAAVERGDREIDTGHLLLGLFAAPEGLAAQALEAMLVSRDQVEEALLAAWPDASTEPTNSLAAAGPGQGGAGQAEAGERPPMAADGRLALLNAVAIAIELGHNYVGTEHMLLALYRDPDSLGARVLAQLGADASEAKVRITEMLRGFG